MGTQQERVAHIEGQMVEQSQTFLDIRADIRHLGQRLDQRMDRVEQRMDGLHDGLHDKMSRHFIWIVGILLTTLVAILSAVLTRG